MREGTFGEQLREMRRRCYDREGRRLSQLALANELPFPCDHTLISHWEHDRRRADHFQLVGLVEYFAGKPGCLETPRQAQHWARLLGETLSKGELQKAFPRAELAQIEEALILDPSISPAADLTPDQLHAYLELVTEAFGHWSDLYVSQEADELRSLEQALPHPNRGIRRRVYEHVQERPEMVTRERLQVELLDWFLEHRHMALLAVPGCGKSTALEEMAWELAYQQLREVPARPILPVLVPLGSYKGEPWPEFLPEGIRKALVFSLLRFGDWERRGLSWEEAEEDESLRVNRVLAPLAEHLDQLRQEGRLVLFLDGLNELAGGANSPLRASVEEFVREAREHENRVAVTCRSADYTHYIARLHRVELLPFDDDRIYEALEAYLGREPARALWQELIRPENQKLREMLAIPLYVELLVERGVLEWNEAEQPRLPSNRGELLARFARTLIDQEWQRAKEAGRPLVDPEKLHEVLAEVAYGMRDKLASRGSQMSLAAVQPLLAAALAYESSVKTSWVYDLAAGAKVIDLDRETDTFSFWKEPLEEYFAARHLLTRFADGYVEACQELWRVPLLKGQTPAEHREFGEPPVYPPTEGAWEETTVLAAGLAGTQENKVSPDQLVEAVLAVNPGLAGRCLFEGDAQVSPKLRQKVEKALLVIMQDRAFSVRVRVPCGVLLGRLGDPRFHGEELFCLPREPMLGFIQVPAGPFYMGNDAETVAYWNKQAEEAGLGSGWYDDELGHEQPVEIPYPYWMARYPVTNAQFRCFVADGGYTSADWRHCWTEAGLRWLDGERWPEELERVWDNHFNFWKSRGELAGYDNYAIWREQVLKPFMQRMHKDKRGEGYWVEPLYNVPNQPVVGVSWYETLAYANWLTEKLSGDSAIPEALRALLEAGYCIRLASEAEWEKGARGGLQIPGNRGKLVSNPHPARQWPWSNQWDPESCNSAEGAESVRWLSPAGMYPDGASPYGCLDMMGNVWEWTRSLYRPYPYVADPEDGREDEAQPGLRVVRGGSWGIHHRYVRCAARVRFFPYNRNGSLGVRVVCAPRLF